MTSLFARTLGAAALIAITATGAMAQETTNQVAVMTDWSVFTDPASGAPLAIEESIYMGEGIRPRKTKQLVITSLMDIETLQIKWALQRELL